VPAVTRRALTVPAAVGEDEQRMEHARNDAAESRSTTPARAETARAPVALPQPMLARLQQHAGNRATGRILQRVLEVRPPGRREASAYDRRQELIDRLNQMAPGMEYFLRDDERTIDYVVIDEAVLTPFDHRMREFIDQVKVLPMRLITREGYVGGSPLRMDSLQEAYVDLDDLLSSSDLGLQMILIHFLTERNRVPNYERRIGTPMPEFDVAHRAGRNAETQHLRDVIGDDSINYVYEERRNPADPANSNYVIGFRSRRERYWVFQVYSNRRPHGVRASTLFVQMPDKRRLTVEELIAERGAAAAPAPAGAPAAPAAPAVPAPAGP
jgi:hypothetical protein